MLVVPCNVQVTLDNVKTKKLIIILEQLYRMIELFLHVDNNKLI